MSSCITVCHFLFDVNYVQDITFSLMTSLLGDPIQIDTLRRTELLSSRTTALRDGSPHQRLAVICPSSKIGQCALTVVPPCQCTKRWKGWRLTAAVIKPILYTDFEGWGSSWNSSVNKYIIFAWFKRVLKDGEERPVQIMAECECALCSSSYSWEKRSFSSFPKQPREDPEAVLAQKIPPLIFAGYFFKFNILSRST